MTTVCVVGADGRLIDPLCFRIIVKTRAVQGDDGQVLHLEVETDPPDALAALESGAAYEAVLTKAR